MTTIATTNLSIGTALAALISGGFNASAATSASPDSPTDLGHGTATVVALSDQAKANIAQARANQVAVNRLQAYAEAHNVNDATSDTKTTATDSLRSILEASTQPTTGGSKLEAIAAQTTAIADTDEPQPFQTFTPTKSLSKSVTYGGFTLTLSTDAGTQFYGIELSGNGVQAYNKHFGAGGGVGGAAVPQGVTASFGIPDSNNEAEDAITITQSLVTASSASASSSSAGSSSTSSVNAQSSSITFLVNYATGQISVEQSAAAVSAESAQLGSRASTLSTLV